MNDGEKLDGLLNSQKDSLGAGILLHSIGFLREKASMAMKINPKFAIVAITLFLLLSSKPSNATAAPSEDLQNPEDDGFFSKIKNYFFPIIYVTLFNEGDHDILFSCNLTPKDKGLYVLGKGEKFSYKFRQIAFPMRWCYLYINDEMNGFFWSYHVRLRCTKCFWSIRRYAYMYRSDRTRWERQQLFMPREFDINLYKKKENITWTDDF